MVVEGGMFTITQPELLITERPKVLRVKKVLSTTVKRTIVRKQRGLMPVGAFDSHGVA